MSISKIKFNNNQEAFFSLDSIEEINKNEFKTFLNLASPYFLKCEFDSDQNFNLYYKYGERIMLKKLIAQKVSKHEMLAFIKSLVQVFIEAEECGLNPEHIELNINSVFYNQEEEQVSCIYLPIIDGIFKTKSLRLFIKELLVNVLYSEEDNMEWLGNTIRYLGYHRELSYKEFYEFLDYEDDNAVCVKDDTLQPIEEVDDSEVDVRNTEKAEDEVIENIPAAEPVTALKEESEVINNSEEVTETEVEEEIETQFIVTPVIEDQDEDVETEEKANDEVLDLEKAFLIRRVNHKKYPLTESENTIGKALSNDVAITGNPAISRVHAVISIVEDHYYIKDNGSTNHTVVNGFLLEEGQEKKLDSGDRILFGNEEFIFKIAE